MEVINDIYAINGMVVGDADVMWRNHRTRAFTYLVAEDRRTGKIVGTVTGVDHRLAFGDPEGGTSLWCLAVHPQDAPPGTGEAVVRVLAERYVGRGRAYLDLSVMHDNTGAIQLYRKLGFTRVAAVCVKRKNPINTPLFAPRPAGLERAEPVRADHRRRGPAARDPRRGDRSRVRRAAAVGRRPDGADPRVAVGVHHGRGAEPVRRQAGDPADHGARRGAGRPRGGRRRGRPGRGRRPDARGRRGGRQARPRRAGTRHHRRGDRRRRPRACGRLRRSSSARMCWSRSWWPGTTCGSS